MNTPLPLMALVFVVLLAGASPASSVSRVPRGPLQTPSGEGKKKKPPPGAIGFEQFAGRDAADKLIKGAATRRYSPAPRMASPRPQPVSPLQAAIREGEKQAAAGNFEAAVAAYREAIRLSTDATLGRAELHYALGRVYSDMGRYQDAVTEFQSASSGPHAGEVALYATYALANAHLDLGAYAQAIAMYEKTLKILSDEWHISRPEDEARGGLGTVRPNRPQIAAWYLAYPHYSMGLARLGLKQKELALADFEKAVELKPDFPEAHFNLGLALWQLGRKDAAQAQLKRLKELDAAQAERLAALFK